MNSAQVIEELTAICIRQAEIIQEQAFVIEQLGAQAAEDHGTADKLEALTGYTGHEERRPVVAAAYLTGNRGNTVGRTGGI